jgi:hypothetical protein
MKPLLMICAIPKVEQYWGVFRNPPNHLLGEFSREPIMQGIWEDLLEFSITPCPVENIERALEVLSIYNSHYPVADQCQLIEVTEYQQEPQIGTFLYGYDIASTLKLSPLFEGRVDLSLSYDWQSDMKELENLDDALFIISQLFREHFRPRLNQYGLFGNYADARLAAEVLAAFKIISPPGYEDSGIYIPLGIWYVAGAKERSDIN